MKKIVLLFSIIFFISCFKTEISTYEKMKLDKLLSESFTDNEIRNLAKIVDFFEEQISEEVKGNNTETNYNKFLKADSIRYLDKNEMYWFDYKKQVKLYSILDSTFFNSFWNIGTGIVNPKHQNALKYQYFHLKVFENNDLSKYAKFISKLSKKNKFVKEYYERVEVINDFFNPVSPINLTLNHNNFNKKDVKIRLIYSFHYLNINEENNYIQQQ